MERDYGKEIDELRGDLGDIKQLLSVIAAESGVKIARSEGKMTGHVHMMKGMHPDNRIAELMEELCENAGRQGNTGFITYLGVFASGSRQSNWARNGINTDDLLALIENNKAMQVLSCIGNSDRLNILLTLLKQPMTVAALVEHCGFGTTGQAYHHLKPLIAADLVFEPKEAGERGVYAVVSHRVQGIIMLLAGVSDMLDTKYTRGDWAQ